MPKNIARYLPNYYYSKVVDIIDHESTHHYHHAFEIYYMLKGECNYFIGNRSYKVLAGDVILIPSGIIHRTNYEGKPHTRQLINCSLEYIPETIRERLADNDYLYRNALVRTQLDDIFNKIEHEYEYPDAFSADVLKCHTAELLFTIFRNKNEFEAKAEESSLISQTIKHIKNNYMNEVKLSMVAKEFSVSAEHLSRAFKKETGFGFNEYLTILRLQKAEDMLRNEPGRAVSEIAYSCGFNDGNYFSYKFKTAYGVSPSQIRSKAAPRKSKIKLFDQEEN